MSHIAEIAIDVKDLECLRRAADRLGLEYDATATTYRWYGRLAGSGHTFPAGFTRADVGQCDAGVLRVRGACPNTYEIGVCRRRDGRPGYLLQWDAWMGGYGLQDVVGANACRLTQEYAAQVVRKQARLQGMTVRETTLADGSRRLVLQVTR
jgi:hypothetical protein